MTDYNVRDTLYAENGGFIPREGGSSNILLKKRYSSMVCCPGEEQRRPGAMYPRCISLAHNGDKNGTLLATMEWYNKENPFFPIYESTDEGRTWHFLSSLAQEPAGVGIRFQPHLFEVPCDMGGLREGTILCAGNIIQGDFSTTTLQLYKSVDAGKNWKFVSEILQGGKATPDYGRGKPVWEPFLLQSPDNKLYCYYSDERYKEDGYNQLLAHKVSEDGGCTWGEEKIDVAFADGKSRPGMPVVEYLPGGKFIMVYEMVNEERIPVYFRISESMDDWGSRDFIGNPVISADGSYPTGTPYVLWIPKGGELGTLLVSGRGYSHIFANSCMGEGFWEKMDALVDVDNTCNFTGYSQCMIALHGGKRILNLCPRHISPDLALIEAAVADVFERV